MSKTTLTPTGLAWLSLFALALVGGWAVGQLAPTSSIGAWFTTPLHFAGAFIVLWLLFTIGSVVLAKLGHPMSRKH